MVLSSLVMLIEREGHFYATVACKVSLYWPEGRLLILGGDGARLYLTGDEIEELFRLLKGFVKNQSEKEGNK